jgi:Na+/H+-translocating membrane pyrophosphatase
MNQVEPDLEKLLDFYIICRVLIVVPILEINTNVRSLGYLLGVVLSNWTGFISMIIHFEHLSNNIWDLRVILYAKQLSIAYICK